MTQFHTFAPGLTQLLTECSPELRPFSTAQLLIGSLRNWASAVAFYNLALDPAGGPVEQPNHRCRGCRGIVSIDPRTHRIRRGLRYYQLGQLSKFVHRGAVRIGSNTFVSDATNPFNHFYDTTPGLNDVAFMNPDGGKVLTTYNNSRRTIQFAVSWHGLFWLYRQPPHAMTTFSWK